MRFRRETQTINAQAGTPVPLLKIKSSARRSEENFPVGEQCRVFDHPAEFFFGHMMMRALVAVRAGHFLVIDGQTFQPHDAKVAVAFLPNLTLF